MRITVGRTWLAPIVVGLLSACGEADVVDAGYTVRDSAGIRIAESPAAVLETRLPWTLGSEPDLQIGDVAGEEPTLFTWIRGVAMPLPGVVVVLDRGSHGLSWFDETGHLIHFLGGEGEGPGEFGRPSLVPQYQSDSLLVYDSDGQRFTVIAPDGSFHRLVSLPPSRPRQVGIPAAALGNHALFRTGSSPCMMEEYCEGSLFIRWVDPTESSSDTLLAVPSRSARIFLDEVPYLIGAPTDPGLAATVGPEGPVVAPGPRFEVQAFDPEGRLRALFRVDTPERRMSAEDLDRLVQDHIRQGFDPRAIDEAFDRMGLPDAMPAFQSLLVDRSGWLWAELFRLDPSEASEWLVFDPSGEAVGVFDLPPDLAVHEIGENYVLGTWRDDLDVEYVRRYRLTR